MRRAGSVADGIAGALAPHAGIIAALCDSSDEAEVAYQLALARQSAASSAVEPC